MFMFMLCWSFALALGMEKTVIIHKKFFVVECWKLFLISTIFCASFSSWGIPLLFPLLSKPTFLPVSVLSADSITNVWLDAVGFLEDC